MAMVEGEWKGAAQWTDINSFFNNEINGVYLIRILLEVEVRCVFELQRRRYPQQFTSHLYGALCQKGIYTFIDNEKLKRGEKISTALERAIEDSRISVVVLSKTYAFSSSCLDEVLKILEIKDSKGQLVLPVFYNIDPSEVRHQKRSFHDGFLKHEDNLGITEKVSRWRAALSEIASLSGWHLNNGNEPTFIQRIGEEILSKPNRTPLKVAKHPVGLESPLEDINSLLGVQSENDVRVIGIHGIGGIGKTTLAKALYNQISYHFEASTFIANVREISKQNFGLVQLQQALLSETLNYRDLKVGNVDRGINLIKNRLCSKGVLIVLDDVDSMEQLESLVGENNWFGLGSRVIITTRDEHLLIAHSVEAIYKAKELRYDHALELLSWYAFRKPYPPTNYEKLSMHILNYAKGLPLALTVLGSYLSGKTIVEWMSA
ncbi:disease resistance protein RPV1-like [Prosopis cineraria]|uniref:disease resistance protein RPV1-like n=1 Tax=Prosopis cineraria TaxID=364024 RepID=UPI00240F87C3|nr:disease resistance protein RPV1-like [Prosopis cineraria]